MKRNKKAIMALSFCVGAAMFVTTAFADITSKTGYDQLKDAIKTTAENCTEKLQNYTLDGTITLKDNGNVLVTTSTTTKFDRASEKVEDITTTEYADGKKESGYNYRDSKNSIYYNQQNDTYYVTEFTNKNYVRDFKNPFREDVAGDVEKIFDAVVGNLKDYVIVNEKEDGSKELTGSLNEAQIPVLVNAVSSFIFKQAIHDQARLHVGANDPIKFPQITDGIFVKKVKGKADVNKDGIIESMLASGILSGKDKDGNLHELELEILGKVMDINATTVTKPDLTGKKVEKSTDRGMEEKVISKKFIGKYKNDIVIQKDEKFIKIGERFVEIVGIDDKHVTGRYYEQYKQGYENYENKMNEFKFDAEIMDPYRAEFNAPTDTEEKFEGKNGIHFDSSSGNIMMYGSFKGPFKSEFNRVFEN
ncbi:MAG: hypothetical protein N2645_17325 [Clostridia bacterium]|nr:hypothetical protein [Clostridia bacterium]